MQRQDQQPTPWKVIIITVICIAFAPLILEVIGFILFMIVAFLAHLFGHL